MLSSYTPQISKNEILTQALYIKACKYHHANKGTTSLISSQKILTHPLTVKKYSSLVPSIKYSYRSSCRHNSQNKNLHMLINFLQEKHFVLNKSKTYFVLSKVPFYRMDLMSTVTADKKLLCVILPLLLRTQVRLIGKLINPFSINW